MSRYMRDPITGDLIPTAGSPVNSQNQIVTFTSSDTTDANADSWTSVTPIASGEQHKSLFAKVSQMFKNVRYLKKTKADKAELSSLSATGSTNNTGSKIDSGKYFYKDGTLCQAKTDIASGATFTLDTNYEVVTAGGLNQLNGDLATVKSDLTNLSPLNTFQTVPISVLDNSLTIYNNSYRVGKTIFIDFTVYSSSSSGVAGGVFAQLDNLNDAPQGSADKVLGIDITSPSGVSGHEHASLVPTTGKISQGVMVLKSATIHGIYRAKGY